MSAQSKSELSKILGRLSKTRSRELTLSTVTNSLVSPNRESAELRKSLTAGKQEGLNALGDWARFSTGKPIDFGSPSHNPQNISKDDKGVINLAMHTASGGLSSAFNGGLLGALGGLGGLISHLTGSLSGGKNKETPLSLFRLPESQSRTLSIGLPDVVNARQSSSGGGLYQAIGALSVDQSPSTQSQNAHIIQVVKNALLTSSSLNDVIADI